jgi:hypothetical protein
MRTGFDRTDVEYVWPAALLRPTRLRLVYLDLNHWIGLAKAATGHPDGSRYAVLLELLRQKRDDVILPLATEHYMEMAGITSERQRFTVAGVMEELSGFACILSGATLMRLEIESAVATLTKTAEFFMPVPLLGRGVLRAFGLQGGLRIRSREGDDVTENARQRWSGGAAAFDALREEAERSLDRSVLRGPTQEEVPSLRALGWDPTVARKVAERRAQQEREQAERLDDDARWRRGRLRDIVGARYLALEAQPMLGEALARRDLTLGELLAGAEDARRFSDSMPTADVRISLLTAAHRNPNTGWMSNDMFDIDALSAATPYCDIVVTERHRHHVLHSAGLPRRLETTVLAKPEELVAVLTAS